MLRRLLASFVLALSASAPLQGDEAWTTERLVELAKSSTTNATIGYVHLDLEKAPLRSYRGPIDAVDVVTPRIAIALGQIDDQLHVLDYATFVRAFGVREALIVTQVSSQGLPQQRFLLRVDPRSDRELALKTLSEQRDFTDLRFDGDLLTFSTAVEWQEGTATVDEEALQAAFEAAAGYPWRAVYLPTKGIRSITPLFAPDEPAVLKRLIVDGLGRDLEWVTLGYDPAGKGRLIIQGVSTQASAAQRIGDDWKEALAIAADAAGKAGLLDRAGLDEQFLQEVMRIATPTVKEREIRLALDGADPATAALLAKALLGADRLAVPTQEMKTSNAMKQIAIGMHNFHDTFRSFPPSAVQAPPKDWQGGEGLSWRVYLLPFLEDSDLYDRFRMDEPWDSEHNKQLIAEMPDIYKSSDPTVPPGQTTFMMPLYQGAFASRPQASSMAFMVDGTVNTLLVVDAAPSHAAIWTKPDDLEIDLDKVAELLGPKDSETFIAAFGDGWVMPISKSIDEETLRRLLQADDGEVVDRDALQR
jgi:hypothetical protein